MLDYVKFYNFSGNPFDLSPDPEIFYPAESHKEALASLSYGIHHRKGLVLILGEAGIGKTLLIRQIIGASGEKAKIVFFPQSDIPFEQLLKEMLLQLNLPVKLDFKGSMLHELYYHLIKCREQEETVAIIMDEAHNASLDVIEEVRLLANLETSTSKLLQIALVGQPELREKLRSEFVRQIKQRIVISYQIRPLTEDESIAYIDYRLDRVGSSASDVFSEEALSLICRHAKGIPRTLNILCHNALHLGHGLSEKQISTSTVKKILQEKDALTRERSQELISRHKLHLPRKISYALLALAVFVMVALFVKNPLPHIFNSKTLSPVTEEPALNNETKTPDLEKSRDTGPKVVPSSAAPEAMKALPEKKQSPLTSTVEPNSFKKEIRVKEIVDVKKGANLYALAYRYYHEVNVTFIDYILALNPEIKDPNLILVNQKIQIPEITESLLIVQSSTGAYDVHLRTFLNRREADRYRHTLASKGKKVEIVPRKVSPKETW
jgi:general secretion pathway protein A